MLLSRLSLILSVFVLCSASIIKCDKASILKQKSFALSPVVRGRDVYLRIEFTSPKQIKDGTATYYTRYNYFPAYSYSEALAPISHGTVNKTLTYSIPEYTFGNIQVKILWSSPTHGKLLCLELEENLY